MRSDPLRHTGHRTCRICREIGWPVEAVWLDQTHLLVTFAPGCEHTSPMTLVVDPAELAIETQCIGSAKGGRRCRLPAGPEGTCVFHRTAVPGLPARYVAVEGDR